jgi:uncharacterized protein YjbJ (UPF0337 family)
MKRSKKDKIKDIIHEVKGKVRETAGQVINNPDLASEGRSENLAGTVHKKLGQIEDVFNK